MTTVNNNPFKPSPPTEDERDKMRQIQEIMGCDDTKALTFLRKKGGNVEQAITAILEDPGDETIAADVNDDIMSQLRDSAASVAVTSRECSSSHGGIIDLTGDEDDEMSRALKASLEDQGPAFGPSNRAPDPNWAVVPSNVEVHSELVSQDDQAISQAIEASLNYAADSDNYDEPPLEERIRKGDSPVALRPTQSKLTYAALILHALFFVPQWSRYVSLIEHSICAGLNVHEDFVLWSLLEIFVNMDFARMSELNVDEALNAFEASHWSTLIERPGDTSSEFYEKIARIIDEMLYTFVFSDHASGSWQSDAAPTAAGPLDKRRDIAVVKVDIRGTPDANDLLSCLCSEFFPARYEHQQAIFEPSDVIAFQLLHNTAEGKGERQKFSYPTHLYLDQFMKENVRLAREKRSLQWQLHGEAEKLTQRKASLTRFNDRDALADLRSSLHYYENIAEHHDNEERGADIQSTASALRTIVARIESELEAIDRTITSLRQQADTVFSCPELQRYKYDLRVVIVHDGVYGRSHLYSYVKQKGIWWKTLDSVVAAVPEETVLEDTVGLHLGAGPYFLIYSRSIPEEEEGAPSPWPESAKDIVKHNNQAFYELLAPEVRSNILDPNSPPTTPYTIPTPTDEDTVSSMAVEPPLSREDRMQID
ncbi:hypothetical protein EW026_g774 [Hermanssonia centrifuga]|uniref:Peptidase C19 ubiquitin carboxyl-terminal hydrolase domain-containing protein n=1 Tax=Hermanssonia centrifuga TaxID=98765 RepID=A0A4S4KY71_9APHY|nr:hypothetical protein EW026_g774 [Hermanssonia centrifuga]